MRTTRILADAFDLAVASLTALGPVASVTAPKTTTTKTTKTGL